MKREVSLEEISDGKLYRANDMVKADCQDCRGCSACCYKMGNSIILDPLDIYRITLGLGCSFEELLNEKMELNIVDKIILPNIKMSQNQERCPFLNEEERCSIHALRPSVCRLFPLGRYYEETGFRYFLQIYECKKKNRSKIKVSKWIDTPNLKENETFVWNWHAFLKEMEEKIEQSTDENLMKNIDFFILKNFYARPYDPEEEFYPQFWRRLEEARSFAQMMR